MRTAGEPSLQCNSLTVALSLCRLSLSLAMATHAISQCFLCSQHSALRAAEQTARPDNVSRTKIDTNRIQSTLTSAHSNNSKNNNNNSSNSSSDSDRLSRALYLCVLLTFLPGFSHALHVHFSWKYICEKISIFKLLFLEFCGN